MPTSQRMPTFRQRFLVTLSPILSPLLLSAQEPALFHEFRGSSTVAVVWNGPCTLITPRSEPHRAGRPLTTVTNSQQNSYRRCARASQESSGVSAVHSNAA